MIRCDIFILLSILMMSTKYVSGVNYVVNSSAEFQNALNIVNPGDQIELKKPSSSDPNYPWLFGNFVAARNGTAENRITILGNSKEVGLTTNASFISAITINGNYWILRGFKVVTTLRNGCAVGISKGRFNIVEDLEINASTYGIDVWSSDNIFRNCKITSQYISIRVVGSSDLLRTDKNEIINNTIIYDGAFTPNGSSSAIGIFVNNGFTERGTIESNLFFWTKSTWQYWVFLAGDNYLIRNNTGSAVSNGGFYVTNGGSVQGGRNNTFQHNHCKNVTNGFCIKVDEILLNSTCIWSDNSYEYALGLSNKKERCDEGQTERPETCDANSNTTTVTSTNVERSEECYGMIQTTTITTTTTITLEHIRT